MISENVDRILTDQYGTRIVFRQTGWRGFSGKFYNLGDDPSVKERGGFSPLWQEIDSSPPDEETENLGRIVRGVKVVVPQVVRYCSQCGKEIELVENRWTDGKGVTICVNGQEHSPYARTGK